MSVSWWEITVLTLAVWKALEISFWIRKKFVKKNVNNSFSNNK